MPSLFGPLDVAVLVATNLLRRAVVPGFYKRWLKSMVDLFADRAEILVNDLEGRAEKGNAVDMELPNKNDDAGADANDDANA